MALEDNFYVYKTLDAWKELLKTQRQTFNDERKDFDLIQDKDIRQKIEQWYPDLDKSLQSVYSKSFKDIKKAKVWKLLCWGKSNSHLLNFVGLQTRDLSLHKEMPFTTFWISEKNESEKNMHTDVFYIDNIKIRPVEFFDDCIKLEYCHSFCVRINNTKYHFKKGETLDINRNLVDINMEI